MGVLARLFGIEKREAPFYPGVSTTDSWNLLKLFGAGGWPSATSPEGALSALAVAERCVALVSRSLAAAPLPIYRKLEDGGRIEAPSHPLWNVLNSVANEDRVSSFELREALVRDVAISGNGYAQIERDGRGAITGLRSLPWRTVSVERLASGRLRYRTADYAGRSITLLPEEILHCRYASKDSVLGLSPLQWSGGAVELAVSQALLAQSQADRGLEPTIIFESDSAMFGIGDQADAAFRRLKAQLTERVRNLRSNPDPILLEGGYKGKAISSSSRESQFHEARILALEQVAICYGVPLSVVGLGRNASYGSLTEESRALVAHCLRPWASAVSAAMMAQLLSDEGRRNFTISHDLGDFQRGSPKEQIDTYRSGIEAGVWSPNEIRKTLELNSRPRGDEFVEPRGLSAPSAPAKEEDKIAA